MMGCLVNPSGKFHPNSVGGVPNPWNDFSDVTPRANPSPPICKDLSKGKTVFYEELNWAIKTDFQKKLMNNSISLCNFFLAQLSFPCVSLTLVLLGRVSVNRRACPIEIVLLFPWWQWHQPVCSNYIPELDKNLGYFYKSRILSIMS